MSALYGTLEGNLSKTTATKRGSLYVDATVKTWQSSLRSNVTRAGIAATYRATYRNDDGWLAELVIREDADGTPIATLYLRGMTVDVRAAEHDSLS